jgi:arylsulfatase A-like enzyme
VNLRSHPRVLAGVIAAALSIAVACSFHPRPHNVIIFVSDGLRSHIVTPATAPTMAAIRAEGVDFQNSHSLFPTVTTANASAIATGHRLGDTGDFGNTLYAGDPPLAAHAPSRFASMEDDPTLADMDRRFGGDYLGETTLLEAARKAGFQTAAVGKLGPTSIQDVTARDGRSTVVIDDEAGHPGATGLPLPDWLRKAIAAAGLAPSAPDRSLNDAAGDFQHAGTLHANQPQQDWFTAVVTQVLLPRFKAQDKPFVLVFWSRDPDGSQHDTGDSLNSLIPGINGPTSLAGIRNADTDLARIRKALQDLGLEDTTDIVLTADHGFSTNSRQSATSPAAKGNYADVLPGFLPPGFLAMDLSAALNLPVHDAKGGVIDAGAHPKSGTTILGADAAHPDILIGANSGADLLWLPGAGAKALAARVVKALTAQDYVAAVFVDDALGPIPGTLPFSAIGLEGSARTPRPSIVVSFRSFSTGCADPEICAAEVADSSLQQGQGVHGAFSRADTHNFMAAIGPDFRRHYRDAGPVSNADLAITLAEILKLDLGSRGALGGRVLREAKRGGDRPRRWSQAVLKSAPGDAGFVTELHYQRMGDQLYFDYAGAPGRVVTGVGKP